MIARRTVALLGVSQLVCWGVSFYLIGVFGDRIVADTNWSRSFVFGGFSVALLVMGLMSPVVGKAIDRIGGGRVMAAGSLLTTAGCAVLAIGHSPVLYYAAWVCLGLSMRMTLYHAAFAALARIGGEAARRPISHVTLLGGLASTCFWPIGHALAESFGWRGAVLVYAGLALATIPLHLAIPSDRPEEGTTGESKPNPVASETAPWNRFTAAVLYALIISLSTGLSSAMSAHLISLLTELGLAATLAVSIAALRGIGQSSARLAEVLFGKRLHPIDLNLIATFLLPLCFVVGLASGGYVTAAIAFSFFYGAGNGLMTITSGTMPLVLFDVRTYGAFVGKLAVPSFLLAAISPLAFAFGVERLGAQGVLYVSAGTALIMFVAAILLRVLAPRPSPGGG